MRGYSKFMSFVIRFEKVFDANILIGKQNIRRYVVGSKSFRPDIQKPRQLENAVRDI